MMNQDMKLKSKVSTLARRLEKLEIKDKKVYEVIKVLETYAICESKEHITVEYPTIPTIKEIFSEQAAILGMVGGYNQKISCLQ